MELALFLSCQSFLRSKEQATLWIIIQIKKEEGEKPQKEKRKTNRQTKQINPTELLSSPVPSS
jgi:hypothetical protein